MRRLRFKYWVLVVIFGVMTGFFLLIYNILGPFRGFFVNAPYLAGFLGTREYLILFLNNYELRPGGGFISAYGQLNFTFGSPSLQVYDVYEFPSVSDRVPAPYAFEYLIGKNDPFYTGWTFRDSNFSPDFPESAEQSLGFYRKAYPDSDIDGVISIDFHAIESLLDLYHGVQIGDVFLDSGNFFSQTQILSKDVDTHNINALGSRKSILKPAGEELISRVVSGAARYADFFRLMKREVEQRHVQIYFPKSSRLQNKLRSYAWDGEVLVGQNLQKDFVHANMANIGGRKGDRYVSKRYEYVLQLPDPTVAKDGDTDQLERQARAKFTARLTHHGDYNIQSDVYQGYFRLFVPDGSILLSPSAVGLEKTDVGKISGREYFADMFRFSPGEQVELIYEYLLPPSVTVENYQLVIPKQAGTDGDEWEVVVKFPNDFGVRNLSDSAGTRPPLSLRDISPLKGGERLSIRENVARWSGVAQADLSFATELVPDTTPPIVLWQEFDSLGMINVRFHEEIDVGELDVSSVLIEDLDATHPNHDNIRIESVRFSERDLWIKVSGVISAPLEKYRLTLYGIRDRSGNVINPNPKEFTLVQR